MKYLNNSNSLVLSDESREEVVRAPGPIITKVKHKEELKLAENSIVDDGGVIGRPVI